ncbi:MAG: nucleotide exchange factor GrpE [Candidatus Heimdallarchaeota archaeon]
MQNDSNDNEDEFEIIDLDYEPEEQILAKKGEEPEQQEILDANQELTITPKEDPGISDHAKELEEALKKKEEEIAKIQDRLLRQQADFENFRKRTQKEIKQIQELASEGIIKDLLPVFDNIKRGLEAGADLGKKHPHVEGLRLIYDQFWKILADQGLEQIQALHAKFDPKYHLAANAIETEEHPPDTVIDEYQPGFMLKSKVIRPSMVVVSKSPKKKDKQKETGESVNKGNIRNSDSESERTSRE